VANRRRQEVFLYKKGGDCLFKKFIYFEFVSNVWRHVFEFWRHIFEFWRQSCKICL